MEIEERAREKRGKSGSVHCTRGRRHLAPTPGHVTGVARSHEISLGPARRGEM